MLKKIIPLSIFLFINMPIAYAMPGASTMASNYLYNIAKNHYEQGNYREAIQGFKKVLLLDPEHKDAQEFIDFIKADLQMPKEVETGEEKKIRKELAEYNIAKSYYTQRKYQEAIQGFKKVLLLDPGNKDAQEFIDFIKAELGMPKEVETGEEIEIRKELAELEDREKEAQAQTEVEEMEKAREEAILDALKKAQEKLKPKPHVSVQPIGVKKEETPTPEIRPAVEPGAWTLPEGSLYAELYNKYYWHNAQFNSEGKKVKWAYGGEYHEFSTELKTEYGFSDDLTLLAYIPYKEAHWKDDNGESQSQGLTDIWLGGKYCFLRDPLTLSLQLRGKFPAGYDEDRPPSLGSGRMDIESRLLTAASLSPYLPAYTKAELGFKGRDGNPTNEIPYFLEFGYNLTDKLLLKTALDGVEGISGTGNVDEDYTKWTISSIYKLTDEFNLQLGYGNTFAGKNSSAADEIIFTLYRTYQW